MTRLFVIAEGLTEANFVSQLLKPHLEQHAPGKVATSAPRLDGHFTYAHLNKFVKRLLGAPGSSVIVTTMVDLFKIPGDFPGVSSPLNDAPPLERVSLLEARFRADVEDSRFMPYLQLHEFEALMLSHLPALAEQHPNRKREIAELEKLLNREFESPEHVNRLDRHPGGSRPLYPSIKMRLTESLSRPRSGSTVSAGAAPTSVNGWLRWSASPRTADSWAVLSAFIPFIRGQHTSPPFRTMTVREWPQSAQPKPNHRDSPRLWPETPNHANLKDKSIWGK